MNGHVCVKKGITRFQQNVINRNLFPFNSGFP